MLIILILLSAVPDKPKVEAVKLFFKIVGWYFLSSKPLIIIWKFVSLVVGCWLEPKVEPFANLKLTIKVLWSSPSLKSKFSIWLTSFFFYILYFLFKWR